MIMQENYRGICVLRHEDTGQVSYPLDILELVVEVGVTFKGFGIE